MSETENYEPYPDEEFDEPLHVTYEDDEEDEQDEELPSWDTEDGLPGRYEPVQDGPMGLIEWTERTDSGRAWREDLELSVGEMARQLGRRLTRPEWETVLPAALQAADRGETVTQDVIEDALYTAQARGQVPDFDLRTSKGRSEFMRQRLADNTPPDDAEPPDSFDMSDPEQRREFMAMRLSGKIGAEDYE